MVTVEKQNTLKVSNQEVTQKETVTYCPIEFVLNMKCRHMFLWLQNLHSLEMYKGLCFYKEPLCWFSIMIKNNNIFVWQSVKYLLLYFGLKKIVNVACCIAMKLCKCWQFACLDWTTALIATETHRKTRSLACAPFRCFQIMIQELLRSRHSWLHLFIPSHLPRGSMI